MLLGKKIKSIRIQNKLTQNELADRSGLSKGFISLLERDLTSPSVENLLKLLVIFDMTLDDFFTERKLEKYVFSYKKKSQIIVQGKGFEKCILFDNNQKSDMEPLLYKLDPGSSIINEVSHNRAKFGYVLSGAVTLNLNNESHLIKKGECCYIGADVIHSLSNEGKYSVKVLIVEASIRNSRSNELPT